MRVADSLTRVLTLPFLSFFLSFSGCDIKSSCIDVYFPLEILAGVLSRENLKGMKAARESDIKNGAREIEN